MFSKSTEYALRAILYLARNSSMTHKVGIAELAEAISSPRSFTAKILQSLTRDNVLISSVTGPNGGFYLTDQAKKRSLQYVLGLLGEDTVITGCVLGLKECSSANPCPLHNQYKQIKPQLIHMMENKTIGDLANEMKGAITLSHENKRKRPGRRV